MVRLRHRLGGRPLLHRLCAADPRRHLDHVRGQAGRHARRRRLLARHRPARRGGAVHGADRLPRHQEGRPRRQAPEAIRPDEIPHAVSRRRARRPADRRVGRAGAGQAGDRPLVADRDRLVHLRQSGGLGRAAGQARLGHGADAGLRHGGGRRSLEAVAARHRRLAGGEAAAAAGGAADAVAAGRALRRKLPRRISRLLQDRGRRLHRRRRLCLRDGPHRRHHQRRRPPALDRRHGGGAGRAPGRRRMRRARHQGRA